MHAAVSVSVESTAGVTLLAEIEQTGRLSVGGGGTVPPPHSTVTPTLALIPALFVARSA
jgi:hypothetical protein